MLFRRYVFAAVFAALFLGNLGAAEAAEEGSLATANPGVVVEIYVHEGETEIACPTTACNAICRDIEGVQVLLADTYYRIGSNCSITITDGRLLGDAIESLTALLLEEVPGGPGQGPPPTPTGFPNPESNPNQNNPGLASPQSAGPVTP